MRSIEHVRSIFGGQRRLRMPEVAGTLGAITALLVPVRYIEDGYFSAVAAILIVSAFVFILSSVLYRTRFRAAASHVLVIGGLGGLFGMAFVDGGIGSEAMFWLPFVPLLAAFLANHRSAIVYTIVALVGIGVLGILAESITVHYFALGAAVVFSCVIGVFLERGRIKYEYKIAALATSHPLTGLPSRTVFDVLLQRAAGRLSRDGVPYVLVFIDVDGLKTVNDAHGHHAGDALLKEVSTRLEDTVRSSESLFHISGDEFVIIADQSEHLSGLKDRIRGVAGVFSYNDVRIPLRVSVGASFGSVDSEASLAAADSDMYEDKRSHVRLVQSAS